MFRRRRNVDDGDNHSNDDRTDDQEDSGYASWFDLPDASGPPTPYGRVPALPVYQGENAAVYPNVNVPVHQGENAPVHPGVNAPVYPHLQAEETDPDTFEVPLAQPFSRSGWQAAERSQPELPNGHGSNGHVTGESPFDRSQFDMWSRDAGWAAPPDFPSRDVPPTPSQPKHQMELPRGPLPFRGEAVSNVDEVLRELVRIDGAIGAALVNTESGMVLGMAGNPAFSLEYAGSGNSEVVRAELRTMAELGITDTLEDILITVTTQYHLMRVIESPGLSTLVVYFVLDRARANLALARHKLGEQTPKIEI